MSSSLLYYIIIQVFASMTLPYFIYFTLFAIQTLETHMNTQF